MRSKNIAIFIDSFGGGGAEKVMLTLAAGLQRAGHYVHFFLLEPRIEYRPTSMPFDVLYTDVPHRLSTARRNINRTALDMQRLVDQISSQVGQFDLHLVNLDPSSQIVDRCEFANVHYVLHNSMAQEIKREAKLGPLKLYRKVLEKRVYHDKNVIAVSRGVACEAKNNWIFTPNKVTTIYNPTDIEEVQRLSHEPQDSLPKEPYLVHAGRVVKQKRHDLLFKALKQVPDIKLVLLCSKTKKAQKLAKKYGVADRVILPGFQENPYPWFRHAQALVSSSDFEGLGMNIIDALLCDTPVVSTNCNFGPSEILTGDLRHFLVPVNDYKALANKINQVIADPPKIDNAFIKDKFSTEVAVEKYLNLCL